MSTEQTEIAWTWDGEAVRVGAERTGAEPTVLLLPAPSYTGSQDPTWNRAYGSQIDSYYGTPSYWGDTSGG